MRTLSTILVLCVAYTLAHESLHHHGEVMVLAKAPFHTEPHDHEHDSHPHHHPAPQSDDENENHDGESHDHQFTALVLKKDVSTHKRLLPKQESHMPLLTTAYRHVCAVDPTLSHPISYGDKTALAEHARARILRL